MNAKRHNRLVSFITNLCVAALCTCAAREPAEDIALSENLVAPDTQRQKVTFTEVWAFRTTDNDKGMDLTKELGLRSKDGRVFESKNPEEISELQRILSCHTNVWPQGTDSRAPGGTIHLLLKQRDTDRLAYVRVLVPDDSKIEPTFRIRGVGTIFYSADLGTWIRQKVTFPGTAHAGGLGKKSSP